MRELRCALLLLLLLLPAARSEAAPILFDFTVDFTDGPLTGQSFQGSFSVDGDDCPGGICDGIFTPFGPKDLLLFDIAIDGVPFDITGDPAFPFRPFVLFVGGEPLGVAYTTDVALLPYLDIGISGGVIFHNAANQRSVGLVSNIEQRAVPEPATLMLVAGGLVGMGVRRWRQRRATSAL